jgi:hypothetical protein
MDDINYREPGTRRKPCSKKVAGIQLRKTIGRNHYRWAASIAGLSVIFTPTLGRYNNRVNGWRWGCYAPGNGTARALQVGTSDKGAPRYAAGHAYKLGDAVIQAQHQAVEVRRFEKGLKPAEGEL